MTDEITGVMTSPQESQRLIRSQQQEPRSDAIGVYRSDTVAEVVDIYLHQAQAYCDQKQWEKAAHACHEALQVAPTVAEAYKLLGSIVQRQGKPIDALGFYAKAITLRPDYPEVYSNLGSIYAGQEQWEKAVSYYQKAINKDRDFAPAYLNLAKVLDKLKRTDQKNECLAIAYRIDPKLGTAKDHYQMGQALAAKGKGEEAIAFYRQAIAQDPKYIDAYQQLADLLEDYDGWQEAAACYRKVMDLKAAANNSVPNNGQNSKQPLASSAFGKKLPLANLPSGTQINLQKLVQASSQKRLIQPSIANKAVANNAIPSQPHLPATSSPTALAPVQQQVATANVSAPNTSAPAQAQGLSLIIQNLKKSIQREPDSASLYRNLAKVLDKNSQTKEAAEAWYRSFLLEPSWPKAEQCLELGDVFLQQGNAEGASNCYRQAIRLQPSSQSAYEKLAQLLRMQGDSKAADALLQQRQAAGTLGNSGQKKNSSGRSSAVATAVKADAGDSEDPAGVYKNDLVAHKRGDSLKEQADWAAAVTAYQESISLNPRFSWSHHSLGDCYAKLVNWTEAAMCYRSAIEINPDFVWSHYSLGDALEHLEDWEAAAESYRQALRLDPENEQVPPRLSGVLHELLLRSPRRIDYYKELAEQLLAQEKTDEAIAAYQMALQIEPNNTELALILAEMLSRLDPAEALALRNRALLSGDVDVRSPEALKHPQLVAALLSQTHLFDPVYYQAINPDLSIVSSSATDLENTQALLFHYIEKGSAEGRNPNPLFNEKYYREQHPDVVEQKLNPLAHYYRFGNRPGVNPHPLFNGDFYRQARMMTLLLPILIR